MSTVVFAAPASAQDVDGDYQFASDDVAYGDVDTARVVDVLANDAGPVDPLLVGVTPSVVVFGMSSGSLTMGLDVLSGAQLGLYEPSPGFSGIDAGEYMVCWGTQCAGATVTVYVGTSACTISADDPSGEGAVAGSDTEAEADAADGEAPEDGDAGGDDASDGAGDGDADDDAVVSACACREFGRG